MRKFVSLYLRIMKKHLFPSLMLLVIASAASSCHSRKPVTFYVTNGSPFTPEDSIQIYVNDSLLVNQPFTYSNIVPNDEIFQFTLSDSLNVLKIVELKHGLQRTDTFNVNKDKYIFFSFGEHKKNLLPGDTIHQEIYLLKRQKYTRLY